MKLRLCQVEVEDVQKQTGHYAIAALGKFEVLTKLKMYCLYCKIKRKFSNEI